MNSTAVNSGKTETNKKLAKNDVDTVYTVSLLLPWHATCLQTPLR